MKIDYCGWRGSFRSAYRAGVETAMDYLAITACPYQDHRTTDGSVTFSRAWARAWKDGWMWGDKRKRRKT